MALWERAGARERGGAGSTTMRETRTTRRTTTVGE